MKSSNPRNRPRVNGSYFVWYLGARLQPTPQWWSELDFGERNWRKPYVLAVKKLPWEESADCLDALAARYPIHLCDRI